MGKKSLWRLLTAVAIFFSLNPVKKKFNAVLLILLSGLKERLCGEQYLHKVIINGTLTLFHNEEIWVILRVLGNFSMKSLFLDRSCQTNSVTTSVMLWSSLKISSQMNTSDLLICILLITCLTIAQTIFNIFKSSAFQNARASVNWNLIESLQQTEERKERRM